MSTATTQFKSIETDARKVANNELRRFSEAASDGDSFRQGDVYITFRDGNPNGERCKIELQLAPGSTQGSRHILDSADGVEMFSVDGDALQGPQFILTKERTVTHPEHGHVTLPARDDGYYDVTYQRAYADELRRVQD